MLPSLLSKRRRGRETITGSTSLHIPENTDWPWQPETVQKDRRGTGVLGYQRTDSMSFTGVMRKPRAIFTMLIKEPFRSSELLRALDRFDFRSLRKWRPAVPPSPKFLVPSPMFRIPKLRRVVARR